MRARSGRWGLAALGLLPVVELALAIAVARWAGAGLTVLALLALSFAGVLVIRNVGRDAWQRFTRSAAGEPMPVRDVGDTGIVLLAGLLLALPGFLTGVAGAVLLVPGARRPARAGLARAVRGHVVRLGPHGPVITGEVVDDSRPDDDDPPPALAG